MKFNIKGARIGTNTNLPHPKKDYYAIIIIILE
jgi:hypothetical protein